MEGKNEIIKKEDNDDDNNNNKNQNSGDCIYRGK